MPGIRRRVVDVMQIRVVGVIGGAPADDMDSPVDDNHSHVVAGRAQRRGSAPFSSRGVIDLVRCDRYLVESAPSDRVDFAVDHGHADRSARAAERSQLPPRVRRGIVFENEIECPNMDIFSEAADRIEFAIESDSPDMGHGMREGSAVMPAICRRIVLLIELRSCPAVGCATQNVDLAVYRCNTHLRARREKSCLCRPGPL